MITTVMFINQSEPLVNTTVRVVGDDNDFVTNTEGKVEIDLRPGAHTFEIWLGHEKVTRTIQRKGDSTLFVVDATRSSENGITTMNTLQVDISELVGDRYVFETVLGRGGMGIVVKAIDRLLNRPVAIKMLTDELRENEEAQQIFLVEARNLATLSHPNLVAIHDILNIEGRVLMIFEYVLGENLERLVEKRGPMKQMDALRMAIQLTRVVAYLHDHELIHRDLKPSNILIQSDGTLKLVDFGLARSLNELYIRGTRVRGTPAYMAPEQIMGIHLTVATDVYQLGITLFEALVGSLPFPTGDMAYAHVHLDPPPLAERRPDLDPDLQRLVDRCLQKQPKDRPATARELLEKLSQIYSRLANEPENSGLAESSVSVPGFDDLRSTREMSAISTSSEIEVDTHFSDMESGEISIIMEDEEESKKPPVMLVSAVLVGVLVLGLGAFLIQSDSKTRVPEEAPKEVAAEAHGAALANPEPERVPEPELVAEVKALEEVQEEELPVLEEPEPEPARPEVNVAAQVRTAPKVVQSPTPPTKSTAPLTNPESEPAIAKPTEEPKPTAKPKEVSVDTFAIEPKKEKGLLKVEPSSKGGLLPIGQ